MTEEKTEQPQMTEDELAGFLDEHAQRAIGHYGSEIASDQARALDYYNGSMADLPAIEGCSSVVDSTVQVTVDNFVANIIKPFVSTDEAVRFEPREEEDVEEAAQATDYVNYIIHCDNAGFMIIHDWIKDAGLQKLGVVKAWWEDTTDKRPQLIQNLDAGQVEQTKFVDGPYLDQATGLYSGFVMSDYEDGRVKIENIPPEEYLISPYARPGEVPPYEAQRTRKFRSDLIDLGFDAKIVADLSPADGAFYDSRTLARYSDEQRDSYRADSPGDPSRDLIEMFHEFVLIDFDGDGVSELREVIRSGTTILYNEESDGGAFHRFTPVPMTHKVYGRAIADLVVNDQRVKTVLQRQQLDNLYKSNNPRPHLPEGSERADGSTFEDLNDNAPGAAVREGRVPIRYEAVPFVADKVFQMQEYTDREIERKTGISKEGQSLDRDALNQSKAMTATQASLMEEGQNTRAELMARIFAETGLTSLCKSILKLVVKHQPRQRVIRLRNKWVPMDPRSWNADMDVTISVGLGIGNQQEQISQAMQMVNLADRVALSPYASLIPEDKAYAILRRAFTALGVKNVDEYLAEPEKDEQGNPVAKPQAPDPAMLKAQAEQETAQAKVASQDAVNRLKLQGEQELSQQRVILQAQEAQHTQQLARDKAASDAQLADDKANFEANLANRKFEQERDLAERMAAHKASLAQIANDARISQNRPGGSLAE